MLPERFLPTADLDGQFGADVDFKASDVFVFVFLFLFLANVKCKHFQILGCVCLKTNFLPRSIFNCSIHTRGHFELFSSVKADLN